jgi:hypothetical protein
VHVTTGAITARTEEAIRAFDAALACWQEWMRHPEPLAEGYPSRAAGVSWRPGSDFEDLCEAADGTLAESVDAAIGDLPHRLRQALHAALLGSRWTGDRDQYDQALQQARAALLAILRRRGVL